MTGWYKILLACAAALTLIYANTESDSPADRHAASAQPTNRSPPSHSVIRKEPRAWFESEERSRLTDRINVYAETRSEDRPLGTLGKTAVPKLLIQCHENTTAVAFFFDIYIGSGDAALAYRLDGASPVVRRASLAEDGRFLGYWSGDAIRFLKEIAGAERILVRIDPYAETSREAEFDLTGIDKQIGRVRKACNW